MPFSVLQTEQDSNVVRDQIRRRTVRVVYPTPRGWSTSSLLDKLPKRENCQVKEANRKYMADDSGDGFSDVESEEEALDFLQGVKDRHEEGKTTSLP